MADNKKICKKSKFYKNVTTFIRKISYRRKVTRREQFGGGVGGETSFVVTSLNLEKVGKEKFHEKM